MSKKNNTNTLLGAAFIMATSAIGPGFLTQTAKFTNSYQGSFGFVILFSLLLSMIVQVNVWRAICVSGLRGQDLANSILPGSGYFIAFLVALGGLVFNIGNVGGAALGFNTLLGMDVKVATIISGVIAIAVFVLKDAKSIIDQLVKVLGALMIILMVIVIFYVKPPVGMAIKETLLPSTPLNDLFPSIVTLIGGTVGGYITFSGAHRLIDAGITGKQHLKEISNSSILGICISAIVRVLMFLAVLGVIVVGTSLDLSNPAADAFKQGAGELGYRFFGIVLWAAAITSIIGAAYTSVSFLKTLNKTIEAHENLCIIAFIALSTLIMFFIGQPAKLLVLAGSLNGLILPFTLSICLLALKNPKIMGEDYHHPKWLLVLGWIVVVLTAYLGAKTLLDLGKLF